MPYFDNLFAVLADLPRSHATDGPLWNILNDASKAEVERCFSGIEPKSVPFGPFGSVVFPYVEMGAITSKQLFGMDELVLFAFYWANRRRYKKVVDFGANIGLHSVILARCGFDVRAFEPDPHHISLYQRNIGLNDVSTDLHQAAIGLENGNSEFVRVLGNTTGSHLKGAKSSPYGDLETFKVSVEAAAPHLEWADFAKIDIEGLEAELICGLPADLWLTTDTVLEVGTPKNAQIIYEHLIGTRVAMYSQKTGWDRVDSLEKMPTSHREGSLFLTGNDRMPWAKSSRPNG